MMADAPARDDAVDKTARAIAAYIREKARIVNARRLGLSIVAALEAVNSAEDALINSGIDGDGLGALNGAIADYRISVVGPQK